MRTNDQIIRRFSHYVRLAKLIQQERALSKRCREMRDKISALNDTGRGYFTSWHGIDGVEKNMTINVPLADYLADFPDAIGELAEVTGTSQARLHYPSQLIGDANGVRVFIGAVSERFQMPVKSTEQSAVAA